MNAHYAQNALISQRRVSTEKKSGMSPYIFHSLTLLEQKLLLDNGLLQTLPELGGHPQYSVHPKG